MSVKTSKKMGAVCDPFERSLGVHSSSSAVRAPPVCTFEKHDSRGHPSKVKDTSVMSYPAPQTGDSALQRVRVLLESGKIPYSSRYPAS